MNEAVQLVGEIDLTQDYLCDDDGSEAALAKQLLAEKEAARVAGENDLELNEDEEVRKKVRELILQARSTRDLLTRAEILIDEEWLGPVEAMPGNIYYMAAFGEFHCRSRMGCFRLLGFLSIVFIQVLAPPLIMLSRSPLHVGVFEGDGFRYRWECWELWPFSSPADHLICADVAQEGAAMFYDWKHVSTTKGLGLLFIMAFTLNGMFVMFAEYRVFKELYLMFDYIKGNTTHFDVHGSRWFALGAFVNVWVVLFCCIDTYVVIGAARCPQDLLMDSLGLLFLYNLDDVGGDLGFVDEDDWDGERIAWMCENIYDSHERKMDMRAASRWGNWLIKLWFKFAIACLGCLVFVLPMIAAITPFLIIAPA